jgi:hypothetical protein
VVVRDSPQPPLAGWRVVRLVSTGSQQDGVRRLCLKGLRLHGIVRLDLLKQVQAPANSALPRLLARQGMSAASWLPCFPHFLPLPCAGLPCMPLQLPPCFPTLPCMLCGSSLNFGALLSTMQRFQLHMYSGPLP